MGPSGGGKSTIIKIIAWYIHPDSGSISIDGHDLSKTKLNEYYKHIGYLTQEPSIFDGTIYENLVYGIGDYRRLGGITKDWLPEDGKQKSSEIFTNHLKSIISLAKCEFIREFEKWLETEIGERGIRLSGGQKQRLAIAKVMLKNPQIIFLDEPSSALDSLSEQQISEAFENLFKGKTVVVIAHRLQTVKEADDIIVLDQWKIIERWTHTQLEKLGWMYKKMLDLQTSF